MSWKMEHSIEFPVSRDFAWGFWANINNWPIVDPAVEWVMLDGPFAPGTKGTTKPRNQDTVEWRLVEVQDGRNAVIEIAVPGATLRFSWRFEDSGNGGTRMTQEAKLEGERAVDYEEGVKGLEDGMPVGMERLAKAIENAVVEQSELLRYTDEPY